MNGVNKVILIGHLGADPEIRHLEGGATLATLSLATSESYKDKNTGERKSITEWHRIVLWNRLAEIAEQYLKKGSPIYIEGKLTHRSYEQDGVTRYVTEIVGRDFQMLGSRNQENSQGNQGTPNPAYQDITGGGGNQSQQVAEPPNQSLTNTGSSDDTEDDLPF